MVYLDKLANTSLDSPDRAHTLGCLVGECNTWRAINLYLIFNMVHTDGSATTKGGLGRKRGNPIDRWKTKQQFQSAGEAYETALHLERVSHDMFTDNTFHITFTYDPNHITIGHAWRNVSPDYQRYVAWIRRHFGECAVSRVYVAQKNGYPHIHCIITLQDQAWTVRKRGGKLRLRARGPCGKSPTEEYLASGWTHGNMYIVGVYDPPGLFAYLGDYTNDPNSPDPPKGMPSTI
jgi:hypothetical protein